jgi:phosphatidylglycerol:prolipoprotein diacylglycerol transferase
MPTQVYILSIAVNTYTLCTALGLLAGMALTLWPLRGSADALSRTLTGLLIIAVCALLGGRIGYVLLNAGYFAEHSVEVLSGASPGYWEHSAIAGGVIGWYIATRFHRQVSGLWLAATASSVGIGSLLGCIPAGCAYGREVFWSDGWVWSLRADLPDAYTLNNPRLPTQLFMMGWLALAVVVIGLLAIRQYRRLNMVERSGGNALQTGHAVAYWILLFGVGDFIIQYLRADTQPIVADLRVSQLADAVLVIAVMLWLIVVKIRCPQSNSSYV